MDWKDAHDFRLVNNRPDHVLSMAQIDASTLVLSVVDSAALHHQEESILGHRAERHQWLVVDVPHNTMLASTYVLVLIVCLRSVSRIVILSPPSTARS